jgi:tRNA modification GTPase
MKPYTLDDTIAAIATPIGEGGIGIVRLSGRQALAIADKVFVSKDGAKPSQFTTYTTHYGHIIDRRASSVVRRAKEDKRDTQDAVRNTQIIDEVILTVMRAPKSYTKEDIVEINCHGGIVPLKKVLELVIRQGARIAEAGEFTRRAFLNGRIDLTQAEAVLDVIRSKTEAGLRVAVEHLEGGLSGHIRAFRDDIMDFYMHLEASIDFPEEDIQVRDAAELSGRMDTVLKKMKALLDTAENGKILREGLRTVICGRANVGKSTLMNALLGANRVIVTPIPGTTRDVVEDIISIDGIPLTIADTAGIIEPSTVIDRESIERTQKHIAAADLVLLLLDGSESFTDNDKRGIDLVTGKKAIIVINKIDLPNELDVGDVDKHINGARVVKISAAQRTNLDSLEKEIAHMVWSGQVSSGREGIITNVRHRDVLRRAHRSMQRARNSLTKKHSPEFIAVDVKESLDVLGEITGESITEEILDRIFSEFCIGK